MTKRGKLGKLLMWADVHHDLRKRGVVMVKIENHLGVIEISRDFFTTLVHTTASRCFGVAGMADPHPPRGLKRFFAGRSAQRGVAVHAGEGGLAIDLHIEVTYGANIGAIVKSIVHKVAYTVEDVTGIAVSAVNVFVDGMKNT